MAILVEADTSLGVHKVVVGVDVQHLVLVGAVGLGVELVVLAFGLIAHVAILYITKDIPGLTEVQGSLEERRVIVLTGFRIVVLVVTVGAILGVSVLVSYVGEVAEVAAAELLQVKAAYNVPLVVLIVGVVH